MMQRTLLAIALTSVAAENYADSTYFKARSYVPATPATANKIGYPYVSLPSAATPKAECPHFTYSLGVPPVTCSATNVVVAKNVAGGDASTWGKYFPTCNYIVNPFQSPIDIRTGTSQMKEGAYNLPEVHISMDAGLYGGILHNDGRNLLIDYTRKPNRVMLSDGGDAKVPHCPVAFQSITTAGTRGYGVSTQMMSFNDIPAAGVERYFTKFTDTLLSSYKSAIPGSLLYSTPDFPLDKYSISGGPIAATGTESYYGQQTELGAFGQFQNPKYSLDSVVFKIGKSEHTVSGTVKKGEIQLKFTRASIADATVLGSIASFSDRVRAFRKLKTAAFVAADYSNPFVQLETVEPIKSLLNYRLKTCEPSTTFNGVTFADFCTTASTGRSSACGVGYRLSCGSSTVACTAANVRTKEPVSSVAPTTLYTEPLIVPGINDDVVYYSVLVDEWSGEGNVEIENLIAYNKFPKLTQRTKALCKLCTTATDCSTSTCPHDAKTTDIIPDYHQVPFNVSAILPEDYATDYYTYEGSVPVPPCNAATWIIAGKTLKLTKTQIDFFKEVSTTDLPLTNAASKSTDAIYLNVRAIQKLRMRRVTRRRANDCDTGNDDDFLSGLFGGGSSFYG